jgi:hypothetical protein
MRPRNAALRSGATAHDPRLPVPHRSCPILLPDAPSCRQRTSNLVPRVIRKLQNLKIRLDANQRGRPIWLRSRPHANSARHLARRLHAPCQPCPCPAASIPIARLTPRRRFSPIRFIRGRSPIIRDNWRRAMRPHINLWIPGSRKSAPRNDEAAPPPVNSGNSGDIFRSVLEIRTRSWLNQSSYGDGKPLRRFGPQFATAPICSGTRSGYAWEIGPPVRSS